MTCCHPAHRYEIISENCANFSTSGFKFHYAPHCRLPKFTCHFHQRSRTIESIICLAAIVAAHNDEIGRDQHKDRPPHSNCDPVRRGRDYGKIHSQSLNTPPPAPKSRTGAKRHCHFCRWLYQHCRRVCACVKRRCHSLRECLDELCAHYTKYISI